MPNFSMRFDGNESSAQIGILVLRRREVFKKLFHNLRLVSLHFSAITPISVHVF